MKYATALTSWLLLAATVFAEPSSNAMTLDDVLMQIKSRQESVRSVKISWTQQTFEAAGSRSIVNMLRNLEGRGGTDRSQAAAPIPASDVEYTTSQSVAFQGDKTNYLSEEMIYSDRCDGCVRRSRQVFDGSIESRLVQPWEAIEYPQGSISRDSRSNGIENLMNLEPVLLTYRFPVREDKDTLKFDSTVVELQGRQTASILSERNGSRRRLSLDSARTWLPVRYTHERNGDLQFQLDFDYREDPQGGSVLAGWQIVKLRQGNVVLRIIAKVTELELNSQLEPHEFQIDFPVGTIIEDLRDRTVAIKQTDGTLRQIEPADMAKSYKELIQSTPAPQIPESKVRSTVIMVNLVLILVGLIAAFRFWRKSGTTQAGQSNEKQA